MRRILYLSSSYFPSRRASSVQVARMCDAFCRTGHRVTLLAKGCREREEPGVTDIHAFYGISEAISVEKIPRPAWSGGGVVHAWGQYRSIGTRVDDVDLVYARDLVGALWASRRRLPLILEVHGPPGGRLADRLWRGLKDHPSVRRMVVISQALADRLRELDRAPGDVNRLLVAHDAAVPGEPLAEETRRWESSGIGPPLRAGYVGHLYEGKGYEVIARLGPARSDCEFHVFGGGERELSAARSAEPAANVVLHGFVPPAELRPCWAELDLLLMPCQERVLGASGRSDIARWMSPLKMFEYMATGLPIVASDLPVIREVLEHERNALLVAAGDLDGWSRAIDRLRDEPELRRRIGRNARRDVELEHNWENRARRVLENL